MVAKLDRLSRSMLDLPALLENAQRQRWALVALDVNVDTTTPMGEAMANMSATSPTSSEVYRVWTASLQR